MELTVLNKTKQKTFTDILSGVFEHSPWIPFETWTRGPFSSIDDLHDKLCQTLEASSNDRKLELIRAHPDLAGKLAVSGQLTEHSANEQQSAQLDKLSSEQFTRISKLNDLYWEKFQFPFIICVKEHTQASIFEHFEERVNHDSKTELGTALHQICRIAWHRLNDIIQ